MVGGQEVLPEVGWRHSKWKEKKISVGGGGSTGTRTQSVFGLNKWVYMRGKRRRKAKEYEEGKKHRVRNDAIEANSERLISSV